jgi:cytoskeletal protein CcmA (bactofilin family)
MATRSQIPSSGDDVGETLIGSQISVRGRIDGQEDLRVHGRVEGAVTLTETLFVEVDGVVLAEVEAHDVVVSGIVVGNVTATNSLTLEPGAKLVGNITTPRLIIADGAAFKGEVQMGSVPQAVRERARVVERRERVHKTGSKGSAAKAVAAAPAETPAKQAPARKAPPRRQPAARPAAPAAKTRAASKPAARPAAKSRARSRARDDDEQTVVVKHAALRRGQAADGGAPAAKKKAPKKKAAKKKKAARARVPARGKRKVSRR